MDFFIDAHQFGQIGEVGNKADLAARRAARAQESYDRLAQKQEKMALICQALLEILQERVGITDEELEAKILEVDLRDGTADGKIARQIVDCSKCGKKASTERGFCVYCGTPVAKGHAFE